MWLLTLLSLLLIGPISPTLSVENIGGSLPGHSTDPEGVAQNAWYPGVSMLGPLADLHTSPRATPSASGAAVGDSADLEIEVWCIGDQLTLGVGTKLNGVELNPESLTLGNGCKSTALIADRLWFTYYFTQCGATQSVVQDDVVYSNFLQYTPDPSNQALRQIAFFTVPVQCTLDRRNEYGSPVMMSFPVTTKSFDPGFSLRAMNGSWTGAAQSNVYRRGQAVHLQARVGRLEDEEQLYVHACHATASPDPKSRPRVRLILKKGCVAYVVSKRGHARFVPSERADAVDFVFTAFRFSAPEIYIHCELAVLGQEMTSASKFCNYNPKKQRWEELSGDIAVCGCCRTQCNDSAPTGLHSLVSIGPLVVENGTSAGEVTKPKPSAPAPLPSDPPVTMETTPAPTLPSFPTVFPEEQFGYPDFLPRGWEWPLASEGVAYLDGVPVQGEVRAQTHSAPQGWLSASAGATRVTWVFPPVLGDGGMLIVRHVPEDPDMDEVVGHIPAGLAEEESEPRGHFATNYSQNGDPDEVLEQYLGDDPSALDDSDPVLEESRLKRWGLDLKGVIPAKNPPQLEPAGRKMDPGRHGDPEDDPMGGVALEDEGLLVQRTETVLHKERGQAEAELLSTFRSRLTLSRAEGASQKLRYEEEEGAAEEERATKRRLLLEEDNAQPSSLWAVLRRMYKAE